MPPMFEIEVGQQLLQQNIRLDLGGGGGVGDQFRQRGNSPQWTEFVHAGPEDPGSVQQVRHRTGETDRILDVRGVVAPAVAVKVPGGDQHRFARVKSALPFARAPELSFAVVEMGEGIEFEFPLAALPEPSHGGAAADGCVDDPEPVTAVQFRHPADDPVNHQIGGAVVEFNFFVISHAVFIHFGMFYLQYTISQRSDFINR